MKKIYLLMLLIFISGASGLLAQNQQLKKAAKSIKAKELKEKLSIIAGADMEGRETATEGQRKAAEYIENYFRTLGLQPGNGTSYQMHFPVYQDSITAAEMLINNKPFSLATDYSFNASNVAADAYTANEIIFAGYGAAEVDFKDMDIKDKWVLVLEGSANNPTERISYSNYQKSMLVKEKKAKGLLIASADFPKSNPLSKGNMTNSNDTGRKTSFSVFNLSLQAVSSLLNTKIASLSELETMKRGNYTTSFSFTLAKTTLYLQSSNVIAVLPGTDKKDEYVFITAHYDHLGKKGDKIYFGADDDGSGTASVLELAEAFTGAVKKGGQFSRSIVFMTVSGEEKGLWGSEYYTDHPIFPLNKTSIDLNIDMVGRRDPERNYGDSNNYIYTIGDDKLSSDLAVITDSVNNLYTHLELDRKFNDLADPNRFYYRSDHYNFAKNGVPVIFYFNGTHEDYHQPTDTVDKIAFNLMQQRVKLIFYTAWEMANRATMLKRDIPLK